MLLSQFVDTHDARGRGEEQPTVLDVRAWAVANHVLNVVVEAVGTWVNTEDLGEEKIWTQIFFFFCIANNC